MKMIKEELEKYDYDALVRRIESFGFPILDEYKKKIFYVVLAMFKPVYTEHGRMKSIKLCKDVINTPHHTSEDVYEYEVLIRYYSSTFITIDEKEEKLPGVEKKMIVSTLFDALFYALSPSVESFTVKKVIVGPFVTRTRA